MARSKIRRLPRELQNQIHLMLESGGTISEITARLKENGADVSRSAVGRYTRRQEKIMENIRRSREAAETIVGKIGQGADEGRIGRALTQMVQTLAFDYINRRVDDEETIELDEIYKLARAVRQATLAGRAGQDHEVRTMEVTRAGAADESGGQTVRWEE